MKWAELMRWVDDVEHNVLRNVYKSIPSSAALGRYGHTKRPNGGEWDLLGRETFSGNKPHFVGLHSCLDTPKDKDFIQFGQFKFKYKKIESKTPEHLSYEECSALVAAAKKDLSGIRQAVLDELTGCGYLKKTDGTYKPAFRVTFKEKIGKLTAEQSAAHDRLFKAVYQIALKHYNFCRGVIYREIPDFFKDDQYQIDHACANVFSMRGAVLEGALEKGYINYADGDDRKMLGAYLFI